MARSVDATRDGLLFMSPRGGYWVGQVLQVAFPYWTVPGAINVARPARVVRNSLLPDFRHAVAVRAIQHVSVRANVTVRRTAIVGV